MGGTQSKATVESALNIVTNVIVSDVMMCASYIMQDQSINVNGSGNVVSGVTMVQGAIIDMQCYQKSRNIVDLQNQIMAAIDQAASSTGSGFPTLDAGTRSETLTRLSRDVQSSVNMSMLQDCVSVINQSQSINVAGNRNIIANVAMSQTAKQLKDCLAQRIANTTLGNTINDTVSQQATAVTKSPFQFLTDIIGKVTDVVGKGFDIVLLMIGGVFLLIMFAAVGGDDAPPVNDDEDYQPKQRPTQGRRRVVVRRGDPTPIDTPAVAPPKGKNPIPNTVNDKSAPPQSDARAERTAIPPDPYTIPAVPPPTGDAPTGTTGRISPEDSLDE